MQRLIVYPTLGEPYQIEAVEWELGAGLLKTTGADGTRNYIAQHMIGRLIAIPITDEPKKPKGKPKGKAKP